MPDCSVDAVVTDPPYGLSFMSKRWDYDVPSTEIWAECLRVLKPGGYLLAFAGTRTQHRMAVRIEDAGFEIRDMLAWMYGSGFPKSHNLDGEHQGWGTALKPAMEPITMARKPFKATVAQNVQEWGTGAINIDGCRIETDDSWNLIRGSVVGLDGGFLKGKKEIPRQSNPLGRFPANVLHDGSAEILQGMGEQARYFYTPKACKSDRENGCFALPLVSYEMNRPPDSDLDLVPTVNRNFHPTVKPTDLMRYLCRMVTPTGGVVLDPFTGSGSTGRGAVLEGFRFIGCEMDADYIEIAKARILAAEKAYQPCLIFD
jgi:predicted RNA methylase